MCRLRSTAHGVANDFDWMFPHRCIATKVLYLPLGNGSSRGGACLERSGAPASIVYRGVVGDILV